QAAKLILESDAKNYVIARKVGYEDANYFSYVFKKAYGMSPSKYRTEHTAQ
ncbi:MAG: AraC family transcriptional regulator, partial [Firmicutes bacterium]|nr:AraC family transcriptional regulator [Bacillota bacterium]